jgi:hypothetical protein
MSARFWYKYMILNIRVDEKSYPIEVPPEVLAEGEDYFTRMEADMARGWQMSREYVESPDLRQRCQIAADRLLGALHRESRQMTWLMAGYILSRMPEVALVEIDTNGEMQETQLLRADGSAL